jgi:hypothetical protein
MTVLAFQEDAVSILQTKLNLYKKTQPALKVHALLNQPKYAPGDTVYYRLDLVTAQGFSPVKGSSFINTAIVNASGRAYGTQLINLQDGYAGNQIILPTSLDSGKYFFIAYSQAMAGNLASPFFSKEFFVCGSREFAEGIKGGHYAFYPEGRNLIEGIVNKVVVSSSVQGTGSVQNSMGDRIANFTISDQNLGYFFINPTSDDQYLLTFPDQHTENLTGIKSDGVGVQVTPMPSKSALNVVLQVPKNSAFRNQHLDVVVHRDGVIYSASKVLFTTQEFRTVSLPLQPLSIGLYTITVFSERLEPLCERLFYHAPTSPSIEVYTHLNSERFGTREKVSVQVNVTDQMLPVESSFAVSVINNQLTPSPESKSDIEDALYLTSSLARNNVQKIPLDTGSYRRNLDLFLISQKGNAVPWSEITNPKPKAVRNPFYMRITGTAFNPETHIPAEKGTLIYFHCQKSIATYQAEVMEEGRFDIPLLFDFSGVEDVVYFVQKDSVEQKDIVVQIDEHRAYEVSANDKLITTNQADQYSAFVNEQRSVSSAYKYFRGNKTYGAVTELASATIEREIAGADAKVLLSDFLIFPTMIETLREIVPYVKHRKVRGRNEVRVYFDEQNLYPKQPPMYIIDGIMTDDTDYFLSLDPKEVDKILLLFSSRTLSRFGYFGEGGIIIVDTRIPDHQKTIPRSLRSFQVQGSTPGIPFNKVTYNTNENLRIPDLRNNLFWSANIDANAIGQASFDFYTSDVPGSYTIVIRGFTRDRKPFYAKKTFEVEFKPASN